MSLRARVLLPLGFFSLVLLGYLYGFWTPRALADARAEYQDSTQRHLDSVVVGLTPLLLGHQLDTIFENLDALKETNEDWVGIELSDPGGQGLYPLRGLAPPAADLPQQEVHVLRRPIDYLGGQLGTLTVRVDFAPRLAQVEQQHRQLGAVMFIVVGAFIVSAWSVLERLVIRPVDALSKAARELAQNQFEGPPLKKRGDDEVGRLVDRFTEMRAALHEKQTALQRYKGELEQTVQQRTAELRLARDAAQAASQAKSAFLANMSHELRTPLNAILGFSSMLRRDPEASARQRDSLDIINRSGDHLLKLINDVLEVAKIEAGRLHLEVAPFDLGAMVRDVIDLMHLRAEEKGLRLLLDQSSAFPRYIRGDEARLRQMLVNLIGNAIKFTEQGGVTLRLGVKDNARKHLLLEVEDTGPGISPEDQRRLFEPFVQLQESAAQRGTGLGLTITRQFAQLMGGSLRVDSVVGRGSTFRLELPVTLVAEADLIKRQQNPLGDVVSLAPGQPTCRILIAEDERDNQLLLSRLMTDLGLEVQIAQDGARCVELFQQWHPHLIWMDRRMPVMDGLEATRRIRQLPEGRAVKIVAVTASAFKEQQQQLLDAGMDDFVRKPYRFEEIYESLARHLGLRFVTQADPTAPAQPVTLTPDMVARLSPSLRRELEEALRDLDGARIAAAIEQSRAVDAQVGQALSRLADDFDYPTMLRVLAETAAKGPPAA